MNQAIFERIEIEREEVSNSELASPFVELVGTEIFEQALANAANSENAETTKSPGLEAEDSLYASSINAKMVGGAGFEPAYA